MTFSPFRYLAFVEKGSAGQRAALVWSRSVSQVKSGHLCDYLKRIYFLLILEKNKFWSWTRTEHIKLDDLLVDKFYPRFSSLIILWKQENEIPFVRSLFSQSFTAQNLIVEVNNQTEGTCPLFVSVLLCPSLV